MSMTLAAASRRAIAAAARPAVLAQQRGFAASAMQRADDGKTSEAGHTARSSGFSKREKAEEERYILERERERYRLAHQKAQDAQKDLEKQKKELEELEAKHK